MSHRSRGGPTCHAKKSQSSPDILVDMTVIDTTEESDSSETSIKLITMIPYFIQVSYLTTILKFVKHQCEEVMVKKTTMKKK